MTAKEAFKKLGYKHRDGTKTSSDAGTLSLEEFNAMQKQVDELGWNQ